MIWRPFAKDKRLVWETWQRSKTFRTPPSQLVGITDPIRRFYFDRAIWMFGNMVESEADQAEANAKSQTAKRSARARIMAKYLDGGSVKGRFRDPSAPKLDEQEKDLGGDFFAGL